MKTRFDRRNFIKISSAAGGSLILGMLLPTACKEPEAVATCSFQPHPILKIDNTGKITVYVARQEIGQGVNTSVPMIVAEELDADWKNIAVEIAAYGTMQPGDHDTGGSQSVLLDYDKLRKAGATAKAMLVSAAAAKWKTTATACATAASMVTNNNSKETIAYSELVCDAAKLAVPKEVTLKSPKNYTLIGKATKKSNIKDILTGKAIYGIDVKVPGMVYAVIERCPVLKGKLVKFDDSACKQVGGFIQCVTVASSAAPMHLHAGVAVIANNIWSAMQARKVLKVEWDEGTENTDSTEALFTRFAAKSTGKPTYEVFKKGNAPAAQKTATNKIDVTYTAPFLAHGTMEPMNFIAAVTKDSCELWGGLQLPDWATNTIAEDLGIKKEKVKTNLTLMGGGFGRRLHFDYALEAARIAKQIDKPVKLIWGRTDDIRNDTYRPANLHRMQAAWDADGKLQAWQHHHVATSIAIMTDGPEAKNVPEMLGGASSDLWYDVPNVHTGYSHVDFNLQRGWVRAVEICVNTFPVECLIDEIATAQQKEPLAFRLSLLENRPAYETEITKFRQDPNRIANVLKLAAEKIGWNEPRKPNHFMGIAGHHFTFAKAYGAHAIEIELIAPKKFRIVRIVAAVDCGIVINPDGLKNQMEGGTVFALSQALMSEINIANNRVVEDSFFNYKIMHFNEMPPLEIHYVESQEDPGGIGEVGLPTVAPALCNALAAAGSRPRTLPIKKEGFEWV
jgi:isoquinoline 1-oxidoreductase subunit beta